jgi:hypothetical protein
MYTAIIWTFLPKGQKAEGRFAIRFPMQGDPVVITEN